MCHNLGVPRMKRARPVDVARPSYGPHFDNMCAAAGRFWPRVTLPPGNRPIFVDLMCQDIRVPLRELSVANGIRRVESARLVGFLGPDQDWRSEIWDYYDPDVITKLAESYGVAEFVDVNALVNQVLADPQLRPTVCGRELTIRNLVNPGVDERLDAVTRASVVRILREPRITAETMTDPRYEGIVRRAAGFQAVYDAMMSQLDPIAFVTSHVEYSHWGLGVDAAIRNKVPVVHVQSTGGLKAYFHFPGDEDAGGDGQRTFRSDLTRRVGRFFEDHVMDKSDLLTPPSDLTAWRSKVNLGRPSWWRGTAAMSELQFQTHAERQSVRRAAMARLGFDPGKPVVTVFHHAVSDALASNVEAFADFATWIEQTASFAANRSDVNWLFLDHPAQARYDCTAQFESLAEQHAHPQRVFLPSTSVGKNMLWSLTDLACTVRGSVSNEFPAYGVPAIQAGWSEWSHMGFSACAATPEEYYELLDDRIGGLLSQRELVSAEQVRRARLWMWLYRSGADVSSTLIPHWSVGWGPQFLQAVHQQLTNVESDGEPVFAAVERAWLRREPLLLRKSLTGPPEQVATDFTVLNGLTRGKRS